MTESGGGSKTAIDGLNVNWSEGDVISMNGCELTLKEGAGTTEGVFEGTVTGEAPYYVGYPAEYIRYDADPLSFSINIPATMTYAAAKQVPMAAVTNSVEGGLQFHNAVNMLKLQLKGDGTNASKLTSIVLTSASSNLSGDISVTFDGEGNPTFNAIAGDGALNTMTVSFGEEGLQLEADEVKCVYIPLAKIAAGEVLTVRFDCANDRYMEEKVTATSAFDAVNNMLDCDVVEVKAVPKFSVSATTKVEFAPGNLWADATGATPVFHFEANQWDFRTYAGKNSCINGAYSTTGTPSGHWGLFGWSTDASSNNWGMHTKTSTTTGYTDGNFKDWGTASGLPSAGEGKTWRTLSQTEWNYLLNSRADASDLHAWKELDGGTHKGLVILPDGTENPSGVLGSITSTSDLATYGAVFLPAAGYRDGTDVNDVGSYGLYWSSTPYEGNEGYAYSMFFISGDVYTYIYNRNYGYSVRLVR